MSKWLYKEVCVLVMCFLLIWHSDISNAQIAVSGGQTAAALAQRLAGQGVTIINPILNCPDRANGFFSSKSSLPGFDSGIVLTTGRAATSGTSYGVNGYSAYLASTSNGTPGDPMLDALAGQATLDACSLEFDMLPLGDTISIDYVFSSEEYISAVCGPYNDAFAFFISGPGITGNENIARVPDTNIPVTINTINNGIPGSTGVIDSCTVMGPGSPFTDYYVDNSNGNVLTHKGLTKVLKAIHAVDKCSTYHLKIVIADAGNPLYDSGVFLKAGSLQTEQYNVSALINPVYDSANAICVKGCLPGRFTIKRSVPKSDPQIVKYITHGNAISGYDYAALPDSVIIPAYAASADVTVNGLITSAHGIKTLKIDILSPTCNGSVYIADSATINIYDTLNFTANPADTSICRGDSVLLTVNGDDIYTYTWTPAIDIASDHKKQAYAYPVTSIIYEVTATLPGSTCPPISSASAINIKLSPLVSLIADTTVCYNSSFFLAPFVEPANGHYVYTWSGPGGFSSSLNAVQLMNVTEQNGGIYHFTVINDTNQCSATNTIDVDINKPDSPRVISPYIICLNTQNGSPEAVGEQLKWYTQAGVPIEFTPVISSVTTAQYVYYVSQTVNGCESPESEVDVAVKLCCDGGIFIPTGFTPNNDGLNDWFEPRPDYGYFIKAVSIYNRWGQLVYSGPDGRWNGKFGQMDADAGTYYYVMTFGCILGGTAERKGDILLIR